MSECFMSTTTDSLKEIHERMLQFILKKQAQQLLLWIWRTQPFQPGFKSPDIFTLLLLKPGRIRSWNTVLMSWLCLTTIAVIPWHFHDSFTCRVAVKILRGFDFDYRSSASSWEYIAWFRDGKIGRVKHKDFFVLFWVLLGFLQIQSKIFVSKNLTS